MLSARPLGGARVRSCLSPGSYLLSRRKLTHFQETDAKFRVVESDTDDPFFNLAFEGWILDKIDARASPKILFLWRNRPVVVIGKHQNPWVETRVSLLDKNGVSLVRRHSGGGAVYQDLGNSCFSFFAPLLHPTSPKNANDAFWQKLQISSNFEILTKGLKGMGVPGRSIQVSGRNDVTVNGCKVSGSAFQRSSSGLLHHGTVLRNVDLRALSRYLTPSKEKLKSKGVKSVGARVINLCPSVLPPERATHAAFCKAMREAFVQQHGVKESDVPVEFVDATKFLLSYPEFATRYRKLRDWGFRFGSTPHFRHHFIKRFDWGSVDVHVDVRKGKISEAVIFSDSLLPVLIEKAQMFLIGKEYSLNGMELVRKELRAAFQVSDPETGPASEFGAWLQSVLS